jgi:hypothetical protein
MIIHSVAPVVLHESKLMDTWRSQLALFFCDFLLRLRQSMVSGGTIENTALMRGVILLSEHAVVVY